MTFIHHNVVPAFHTSLFTSHNMDLQQFTLIEFKSINCPIKKNIKRNCSSVFEIFLLWLDSGSCLTTELSIVQYIRKFDKLGPMVGDREIRLKENDIRTIA